MLALRARTRSNGSAAGRLDELMSTVQQLFGRVLEGWVRDPATQQHWLDYLHGRGPRPGTSAGYCLVVAGPRRARVLTLAGLGAWSGSRVEPLELVDLANRDDQTELAEEVMDQAAMVWNQLPGGTVVVVAPPAMLGRLRKAGARRFRESCLERVVELARDLSDRAPREIHRRLAHAGVLPAPVAGELAAGSQRH